MKEHFDRISASINDGRLADAEADLRDLPEKKFQTKRARILWARLASAHDRPTEAIEILNEVQEEFGVAPDTLRLLASNYADAGRDQDYTDTLKLLEDIDDADATLQFLSQRAAKDRRFDDAERFAEKAAANASKKAWPYRFLIKCAVIQDQHDTRFLHILGQAARHCENVITSPRSRLQPDGTQLDRDHVASIHARWPEQYKVALSGALMLREDIISWKQRALSRKARAWNIVETNLEAEQQIIDAFRDQVPQPDQFKRPLIEDDGSDFLVSETGPSGVGFVVFGGVAQQFGLDTENMDRFIAAAGHSSIFARDSKRSLYLGGIASILMSRQGLVEKIQELKTAGDFRKLVFVGNCAGALAAIKYGCALGADEIRCFGGVTTVSQNIVQQIGDNRAKLLIRRLSQEYPPEDLDTWQDVKELNGRIPIKMFYGAGSDIDRSHAERLRDVKGVELLPLSDFDGHDVLFNLIARNRRDEIFGAG